MIGDPPRWPSATVTKNSKNMKMTISLEILNGLWSNLFQNCPCMKLLQDFSNWPSKMATATKIAKSRKYTKMIISHKLLNGFGPNIHMWQNEAFMKFFFVKGQNRCDIVFHRTLVPLCSFIYFSQDLFHLNTVRTVKWPTELHKKLH